jgi:hypothetical protein
MSAPLAGKFEDYYETLGIDPKSSSDTVQQAYLKLAQQFNPGNLETGNQEKFEAVTRAYEVLSDPAARREFDKIKGIGEEEGPPRFSGPGFFDALGRETVLRAAVLCVLYDRRRNKPFTPSLSMRQMENIIGASTEELSFAIWYLKQKALAVTDDKSSLQITVDGMDFLESHRPSADTVMPLIKEPPPPPQAERKPEGPAAKAPETKKPAREDLRWKMFGRKPVPAPLPPPAATSPRP